MVFENVYIPHGCYWCTPFVRWQGSFSNLHPIEFAADVTRRALTDRDVDVTAIDGLYLGMTVPALKGLYGSPWIGALIGASKITGPMISQACATSARVIANAACELETVKDRRTLLCVTADRTSNGPHLVFPNPHSPGAKPDTEDWVWDSFNHDPFACNAMIDTAENVAREANISTEEQHEMALLRYEQYENALKNNAAFQARYMVVPIEVNPSTRKLFVTVTGDEGVRAATSEGLAGLRPVLPNGTVTHGAQTYPADGNAGMVLTTREAIAHLSRDTKIVIRLLSFAQARERKGFMPAAVIPAAQKALDRAGVGIRELKAIKTHNPFAVNDILFSRVMGVNPGSMNNFGSSLIWGHPQGPTGMRLIIELIEELIMAGGGYGLFTGCSAGDSAAAVVVKVDSRQPAIV